jgi:UDP-N-acetylglucosamine 2-epimerase (non-hydrolysing)
MPRVLGRKWPRYSETHMKRVLFVFGTRPEAIKLCPVVLGMRESRDRLKPYVCVTGQHRELLDQVLGIFGITPDYDLDVMSAGQTLFGATARIIERLETVFRDGFDFVVVQGDTTTTFCGALAGFYARIPIGHVEAGLRTGNYDHPFPEEANRVLTTRLASLHFASTKWAAKNLRQEGVAESTIHITGNPVTDAVTRVDGMLRSGVLTSSKWQILDPAKRLIVVTAHRRESFGPPFERICDAIRRIAERSDVQIVYPVHPNPNVQAHTMELLSGKANITLSNPASYPEFIDLMRRSYLLLSDSGGIQEEAPSLGKPVLVLRQTTERPEAVEAGTAKLVGADEQAIMAAVNELLDDPAAYERMSRLHNPYGDGHASERIVRIVGEYLCV